jgi:DNA-binding winged helix-turn-helix (wHTH) protein
MAGITQTNGVFEFGPYRLDPHSRVLLRDRTIVALTPKVLDTLLVLVENRGATVAKRPRKNYFPFEGAMV